MTQAAVLYLDTSALLKAFIAEEGTAEVRAWMQVAAVLASSSIAALEVASALARLSREGAGKATVAKANAAFEEAWQDFAKVDVDEVLGQAARLVSQYPLQSLDAIHLASALRIQNSGYEIHFACFDSRLSAAAKLESLKLFP
jgi:predicted nucleic acid-binding protein